MHICFSEDKSENKKRLHTHQMTINKEESDRIQSLKDEGRTAALQELSEFENNVTSDPTRSILTSSEGLENNPSEFDTIG